MSLLRFRKSCHPSGRARKRKLTGEAWRCGRRHGAGMGHSSEEVAAAGAIPPEGVAGSPERNAQVGQHAELVRSAFLIGSGVFATTLAQPAVIKLPLQNLLHVAPEGMAVSSPCPPWTGTSSRWPVSSAIASPSSGPRRRHYLLFSATTAADAVPTPCETRSRAGRSATLDRASGHAHRDSTVGGAAHLEDLVGQDGGVLLASADRHASRRGPGLTGWAQLGPAASSASSTLQRSSEPTGRAGTLASPCDGGKGRGRRHGAHANSDAGNRKACLRPLPRQAGLPSRQGRARGGSSCSPLFSRSCAGRTAALPVMRLGAWLALSRRRWLAGGAIASEPSRCWRLKSAWVIPHFRHAPYVHLLR